MGHIEATDRKTSRFATIDRAKTMNAVLRVIGVGGGGCNAVESMVQKGLDGVETIAINTDAQALEDKTASHKLQIGTKLTKGRGTGADPNIGRKAAEEDREKIGEALRGSDMIFITAGMGGGTGTGAAPVIASVAKSLDALVVAIVTKPFKWEGKTRRLNAEKGIQELRQYVDSLIVIPNERLINVLDKNYSFARAFDKPNEVLYEATKGISDIITINGLINVDFADVRTVMNESGIAIMGCGIASGENRCIEAAQKAISSPLLEGMSIKGAKSVLINISGSSNLTMEEINEGNNVIFEAAGEEANVIFGCVEKEEMNDYVSYTVIATGFDDAEKYKAADKKQQSEPSKSSFSSLSEIWKDMESDDKDLEVPTIFRVRAAANNKKQDTESKNNGANEPREEKRSFGLENQGHSKVSNSDLDYDGGNGEMDSREEDDEEDSSSFLRMIMD